MKAARLLSELTRRAIGDTTKLFRLGLACVSVAVAVAPLLVSVAVAADTNGTPLPKISVRQVIEVTKIVQPDVRLLVNGQIEQEISPDEAHFFVITRRQDVALNQNVYELIVFDTDDLVRSVERRRGTALSGRVMVHAASSSNFVFEHALRSAKWLDNSTILFLGEFHDEPTQAYELNVATGAVKQLTHHANEVLAFVYDPHSRVVAYVARVPGPEKFSQQAASYVVDNTSISRLLFPSQTAKQEIFYQYHRALVGEPDSIRALGAPFRMNRMPPLMCMSPDGRFVITRRAPRSPDDSMRLANTYPPLKTLIQPFLAQQEDPESLFTEVQSSLLMQIAIFDLRSGKELPWFDVPDGTAVGVEWPFAHWLPGSESVVIGNTFLPLEGVGESERRLREVTPALIEYWPESGRFIKIADLTAGLRKFEGVYFSAANPDTVFLKEHGEFRSFRKHAGNWVLVDALPSPESMPRVRGRLRLVQALNESPEIAFTAGGREFKVTDFNPQLRSVDIGRAAPFTWRDDSDREWRGGLLLPTDFQVGRRYPLVIQLYGFPLEKFYLDGASNISSAMAGRAYLREGILVLAMPSDYMWSRNLADTRDVFFINAKGIAAGISRLAEDGIIDPERVGIVGFSASGQIVQHVMTFSDIRIRAATIADSASMSLFSAVAYFYGSSKPGMVSLERRLDAQPWGAAAMTWAQRDPSLNTDCVEAAVRFEFNNLYPHPNWDTFALLRRQYKPVEAVIFPRGAHQLRGPQERFDSLQGNVDWFRFWLKDEEDTTAPEKIEQYERWREMKARKPQVTRRPSCILTN